MWQNNDFYKNGFWRGWGKKNLFVRKNLRNKVSAGAF